MTSGSAKIMICRLESIQSRQWGIYTFSRLPLSNPGWNHPKFTEGTFLMVFSHSSQLELARLLRRHFFIGTARKISRNSISFAPFSTLSAHISSEANGGQPTAFFPSSRFTFRARTYSPLPGAGQRGRLLLRIRVPTLAPQLPTTAASRRTTSRTLLRPHLLSSPATAAPGGFLCGHKPSLFGVPTGYANTTDLRHYFGVFSRQFGPRLQRSHNNGPSPFRAATGFSSSSDGLPSPHHLPPFHPSRAGPFPRAYLLRATYRLPTILSAWRAPPTNRASNLCPSKPF